MLLDGHTSRLASRPKLNTGYWSENILKNQERDARNLCALKNAGWAVLELWECDIRKLDGLADQLAEFMTG
jgi:DNA mismatch endonuclease (patch repair protein)